MAYMTWYNFDSPRNLANRDLFREARFGLFIHWGVYSLLGIETINMISGSSLARSTKEAIDLRSRGMGFTQRQAAARRLCHAGSSILPHRVQCYVMGRNGQISRHALHYVHCQTSRRILHVAHETNWMEYCGRHTIQDRCSYGIEHRRKGCGYSIIHLLFATGLESPRLLSSWNDGLYVSRMHRWSPFLPRPFVFPK